MALILKLLFIGVSLQTYYFYSVGLPLISIVSLFTMGGVLFVASLGKGIRFPKNATTGIVLGYVLILLWSILGMLFYGESPDTKRLLAFLVVILGALVAVTLIRRFPLESLVRFYLLVHASCFFLQLTAYYTIGHVIDFLAPVTGEEQRMFGGTFVFPIIDRFMRPTGLFNEPGTYAAFVAPFVALFDRWYGKSEWNKRIFWVGLSSLLLSFSFFGLVFSGLILLFSRNVRGLHRIFGFIATMVLVVPYFYYRFILRPSIGLDTGIEIRQVFLEQSLSFLLSDQINLTFGAGLLTLDPRADLGMAYNDAGLFPYFLHFAGLPLTLLFGAALIYVSIKLDRASRVALLIVLLSKHSLFAPFFPFILVAIFWKNRVASSSGAYTGLEPRFIHAHSPHHHRVE